MSMLKPRTPAGTMELLPLDQIAFQDMLDTIRRNYERFGFLPVETPVFEISDVLLTKSGGETERQVYFVQSTGSLKQGDAPELALRFDLTVPLARYVAEHEHLLSFPFRRYQMQRVYRGESAQRGRFREFYQCDIDIVGKDELSIRYDAEVVAVIASVFRELAVGPFVIQLNNRKLMRGFFERAGVTDADTPGADAARGRQARQTRVDYVRRTLTGADFGLPTERVDEILAFVALRSNSHCEALQMLASIGGGNAQLDAGIAELTEVLNLVKGLGVPESQYALNFSIARGLDYYTGTVYETLLTDHPQIGSVCSGGRYENLASHYTKSRLPGVGISIGATRLYYQLREAGLIGTAESTVTVLVTQMDGALMPTYLDIATQLRNAGINTELVLDSSKLGKQLKYADKAGIRFAVIVGENEVAKSVVMVKDLIKEEQFEVPRAELIKALRVEIEQAEALGELKRRGRKADSPA